MSYNVKWIYLSCCSSVRVLYSKKPTERSNGIYFICCSHNEAHSVPHEHMHTANNNLKMFKLEFILSMREMSKTVSKRNFHCTYSERSEHTLALDIYDFTFSLNKQQQHRHQHQQQQQQHKKTVNISKSNQLHLRSWKTTDDVVLPRPPVLLSLLLVLLLSRHICVT